MLGKILFRKKLYYLETGDLSVIDNIRNPRFYEELFVYALAFRTKTCSCPQENMPLRNSQRDVRNRLRDIDGKIAAGRKVEMPQGKGYAFMDSKS